MEKSRTRPLIDIKKIERELRENGYNERDIEKIIEHAKDINEKQFQTLKDINKFVFSIKWEN